MTEVRAPARSGRDAPGEGAPTDGIGRIFPSHWIVIYTIFIDNQMFSTSDLYLTHNKEIVKLYSSKNFWSNAQSRLDHYQIAEICPPRWRAAGTTAGFFFGLAIFVVIRIDHERLTRAAISELCASTDMHDMARDE
jgi:hypothetical protein